MNEFYFCIKNVMILNIDFIMKSIIFIPKIEIYKLLLINIKLFDY